MSPSAVRRRTGPSRPAIRHVLPTLIAVLVIAVVATGGTVAYLASRTAAAGDATGARAASAQGRPALQTPSGAPSVTVAALGRLFLPDASVDLGREPTATELSRAAKAPGIQGATAVSYGTASLAGRVAHVAGVDPSSFRGFTPRPTAASDPLWQAVARGEAVVAYPFDRSRKVPLGGMVTLGHASGIRIGALAEFSLPGVDAVVDRTVASAAGVRGARMYVSSPTGDSASLTAALRRVLGQAVTVHMLRPAFAPQLASGASSTSTASGTSSGVVSGSSGTAQTGPLDLRTLYQRAAATCPGLPWGVLAGIGQVETDHGRATAVSSAGAEGPMQFLPSTFAIYGVDGNGDGKADINNQADAVYSAARYLCASGGGVPSTVRDAVFSYNHSTQYVDTVMSLAAQYR